MADTTHLRLQIPDKKRICAVLFSLSCLNFSANGIYFLSGYNYFLMPEVRKSPITPSLLPVKVFLLLLGVNYITCPTAYSSNLIITSECFQASLYLTSLNNLVPTLNSASLKSFLRFSHAI